MQLPPPAVFHDKAKRTQQGNLLILVAIDIMVKIIISHGHHCHHGLHHHSHQYRQEKLDSQERQIKHLKGWGQNAKLGPHSAIWGKLGTALQAYALNPCTKFPPNPTSRKVNT